MISVKNLHKSFGELTAVNNLSFEIGKGEIVGFLGPNGAGKTTTMRLLTGYLTPDDGQVTVEDLDIIQSREQVQKIIGYLPENNPLYKQMLVSEMFDLSAELKQIPKKERRQAFDFAVEAVSIEDVFYRPIAELSKGYKQRVGMALALMHRPRVIIMDEPTEGLDPNQRNDIRDLIKNLAKDRTIILSTHVMQEALAISNRILIINKGKLVADGKPEELTKQAGDVTRITVDLEGTGIVKELKKIDGLVHLNPEKLGRGRYLINLNYTGKTPIQKELSLLVAKHEWIVWHLEEERTRLEDVFQQLTKTKYETE